MKRLGYLVYTLLILQFLSLRGEVVVHQDLAHTASYSDNQVIIQRAPVNNVDVPQSLLDESLRLLDIHPSMGSFEITDSADYLQNQMVSLDTSHYEPVTLMYNIMLDWENPSSVTPFIGAGFGTLHGGTAHTATLPGAPESLAAENAIAYQVMTGASWSITPSWEVEFMYRHFTAEEEKSSDIQLEEKDLKDEAIESSYVQVGVTYKF